jgi:hypothetical protein
LIFDWSSSTRCFIDFLPSKSTIAGVIVGDIVRRGVNPHGYATKKISQPRLSPGWVILRSVSQQRFENYFSLIVLMTSPMPHQPNNKSVDHNAP